MFLRPCYFYFACRYFYFMSKQFFFPAIFLLLLLPGACVSPKLQTIWKAETPLPEQYHKILVVAIVPAGEDSLQYAVEKQTVQQLSALGYEAVSYIDGFSIYEIGQLTQEAAYFTLCNKGIDCVLTIAKCDPAISISVKKGTAVKYPASFYFNHIWNYRNKPMVINENKQDQHWVWESILFDLNSLEQQSVLQVSRIQQLNKKEEAAWIAVHITRQMVAEKIISPQPKKQPAPFKPF